MAGTKVGITREHEGERFEFSSYSSQGDNCVGVAGFKTGAGVAFLDSKTPAGPVVTVSDTAWRTFLGSVRA